MPPTPEEEAAAQAAADEATRAAAAASEANDDDDDDDDLKDADVEKLREQLRAARKSERQAKRQHNAVSKELDEIRASQMTEAEKIQKERDDAIAARDEALKSVRERDAREAFVAEATKAGAIRPDALFRLAEDLEYDDDGKLVNVNAVVKSLRDGYPELFGAAGSADGGSGRGTGAGSGGSVSDIMREQLGRAPR